MIAISGALVLVAFGLLATGLWWIESLWFIYGSIAVSLASAVCLVVGVSIGRGRGPARGTPSKKSPRTQTESRGAKGGSKKKSAQKRPARQPARAGKSAEKAAKDADGADADVVVVPGRLRYHLATCRQVTGKETDDLAVSAARQQGYVACTSCRPDSVLAARSHSSEGSDAAGADSAAEDEADTEDGSHTAAADPEPDGDALAVVVVTGQRRYHVRGCQVIDDAEEDEAEITETTAAEAAADGLTPCRVCAPGTSAVTDAEPTETDAEPSARRPK